MVPPAAVDMTTGHGGTFVGRTHEVATLERLCRHARQGGPTCAVVVGEAGAGKSRLLVELERRGADAEFISMSGYEPEQHVPLAAASSLVRRLESDPTSGIALAGLAFRGTSSPFSDRPAEHQSIEPVRLFEVAHRVLAAKGPVVLLVDDLHWIDDLSRGLVHYLVRAAGGVDQPLALVVAGRPSATTRHFAGALPRVVRAERSIELRLAPLDREAGVALALDLAPQLDPVEAERAWERARGSPFWMQLTAQSRHLELDIDEMLRDRLRAATADVLAVLETLAIAGHPVTTESIAAIHGWTERRAGRAAADAERHDLVLATPSGLVVLHDLLRSAVERAASPRQVELRHRQFGCWLEAAGGDDDAELLEALHHRLAGGDADVGLALRIARSRRRRLVDELGLTMLLAVANDAPPDKPESMELVEALARLCAEMGRHEHALSLWSRRTRHGARKRAGPGRAAGLQSRARPWSPGYGVAAPPARPRRTQRGALRDRDAGAGGRPPTPLRTAARRRPPCGGTIARTSSHPGDGDRGCRPPRRRRSPRLSGVGAGGCGHRSHGR